MAINFDLNDLLAFRAVAELTNFRRAAESVHLSQPAFSRRIDKLEQALGVRLLERTTRRVTLTAVGRDFERKVRELVEERFVAACRRDHPVAKLRRVSWVQLGQHDFISVGRTSGNRVLLDQALAGVIGRPQAIYEAQHVTTTLGLVEAGLGVAAVPSMAMPGPDHPLLVSVPLVDPVVTRKVGLIWRRGRSLSPAAQQLFDLFGEVKGRRKKLSTD